MSPQLRRLLALGRTYWPDLRFYREQKLMIESLALNDETVVVAGNELGKDFTAAWICLMFFVHPQFFFDPNHVKQVESWRKPGQPDHLVHTRRIVTTSVKERHLSILWGEIGKFLTLSRIPLLESQGGPLTVNSLEIRFAVEAEVKKPFNYLMGQVAQQGESMAGHHADYTLFLADEASGLWDEMYQQALGWAKKRFVFGNANPTTNFFYRAVRGGNITGERRSA